MSAAGSAIAPSQDVTARGGPRAAHGLPTIAPLVIGQLLGPAGLAVVTDQSLSVVDSFIPLALATMGAMAGLHMQTRPRGCDVGAAAIDTAVVGVAVAVGVGVALRFVEGSAHPGDWWISVAVGLCACCAAPSAGDRDRGGTGSEERSLGLFLPVAAGSLVFAAAHVHSFQTAAFLLGGSVLASVFIAVGGTLLVASWSAAAEHRVIALAMVLLLGGMADRLSVLALTSGTCAGIIWRAHRSGTREAVLPVIDSLDRVFVIVIFFVAGAQSRLTVAAVAAALAYALCLIAAQRIVVRAAARLGATAFSQPLSMLPSSPYAIALALGMSRGDVPGSVTILTVVVLAAVGSHVIRGMSIEGEA